jgi:hypothetical protein
MKIPAAHQIRVLNEHADLTVKINALDTFQGNTIFNSLPMSERCRLIDQLGYMRHYQRILAERIEAFT